ncbi:tetratricopeptide repeat protein [Shewanella ulleungensis]|uniref:tetratricopeptide repeat protein n=1 Tax=Shewanella ulleungensis TaxID=2282699 RepID=UPI003D7909F8
MSVIIKMLRDLEQREKPDSAQSDPATSQPKGEFVRPQVQYYSTEKSRSPLIAVGIGVLLLIPVAWFGVSMYQKIDPTVEPQLAEQSVTDAAIRSADDNAEDMPAQPIGDMQLSTSGIVQISKVERVDAQISNSVTTTTAVNDNGVAKTASVAAITVSEEEPTELVSDTMVAAQDTSVALVSNEATPLKQADEPVISKTKLPSTSTDKAKNINDVNRVVATTNQSQIVASDKPDVSTAASNDMTVKEVVLTKTQMAQLQYRKAVDAEKVQNVDDAASFYLEAIILQPSLHKARKQLVAIYYAQNNTTTAMRLLESGISMFPQEWEFYVILARIQVEMKAFDSANITLASIPDNSSWSRDKWVAQTELAQSNQDYIIAEQAYRNLLQAESTQARWWMGLGYALDSQQKYIPAAQAYRSALSYEGLSMSAMNFIETRLAQLGENR